MASSSRSDHTPHPHQLAHGVALVVTVFFTAIAFATHATADATTGNASFGCSHGAVDWTVPDGVASVDVVAIGASGSAAFNGPGGGLGARVSGSLAVTPGETLHIRAGCSDGFNGGGGTGSVDGFGNGGGATDIRQGGDALSNRVLTAAGGGGGGTGGAGGSATGETGGNGTGGLNDGIGATPTSGGYRGGGLGQGGVGEAAVGGGGGGGGVYGGGGSGFFDQCPICKEPITSPGGGGGAGSSAGPVGSAISTAPASGHGSLSLSWVVTVPAGTPTTTTITDSPDPSLPGDPYTIVATVTSASGSVPAGSVRFTGLIDGTTIVVTLDASGTATIVYSAQPVGTITFHAEFLPAEGFLGSEADATHTVAEPEPPDTTAPAVITSLPAPPASGWFTAPVTGSVAATDDDAVATLDCVGATVSGLTGIDTGSASAALTILEEGASTVSCTALDPSNNQGSSASTTILVDSIDPTIEWFGGPTDGAAYVFGSVPDAPTCSAIDGGSGPASCAVTGYSSAVGTHVLEATATDIAGNASTATRSYTVSPWQLSGFYSPVDMGGIVNTAKGGSTVPLKFEVFVGGVEQTSTAVVRSLRVVTTSCNAGLPQDEIEVTAAGDTVLRYDDTAGVFIYNWKTPKLPGACVDVIVQTLDGSTISAHFRLR